MATLSRIVADVKRYAGNPTDADLPLATVLAVIYDINTSLNNDLIASNQNWLVEPHEFNPSGRDVPIEWNNFNSATLVERKVSDADEDYETVRIVSLTGLSETGQPAVTFYGSPQRMRFNFDPSENGDLIRVWEEPNVADAENLDETPLLNTAFHTLLKFRAAAICRALLGMPSIFDDEIMRAEAQWKKWRMSSREEGLVQKSGFRPNRSRSGVRQSGTWFRGY